MRHLRMRLASSLHVHENTFYSKRTHSIVRDTYAASEEASCEFVYFRQPLIHLRRVARVCASPFDRISKVTFQLPSLITSPSHAIPRCALLRIPPKNLFLYPLHTQYTHTHTQICEYVFLRGMHACITHVPARTHMHARSTRARAHTHTHTQRRHPSTATNIPPTMRKQKK